MKKVIIVDGNSLAFTNMPNISKTKKNYLYSSNDGRDIYASRKFLRKLLYLKYTRFIDYSFVVIFDQQNKHTFRHELSKQYKSKNISEKRQKQKDYIYSQIEDIKKALKKMNIPYYSSPNWEADDIIGMLRKKFDLDNTLSTIITGDKDLFQLATKKTRILYMDNANNDHMITIFRKDDITDGIKSNQIIDKKILSGDSSDNIKGLGIIRNGKVDYWTNDEAIEHLNKWKSISNMYKNIDLISNPYKKSLIKGKEKIKYNRKLVTIIDDWVLNDININHFKNESINIEKIIEIIYEYNLEYLLKNKRFAKFLKG